MRKTAILTAACAALAFSGCSTVESIESNLASPTTQQAVANVKGFSQAFVCALSAAAAAAQGVEAYDTNGKPIAGTNVQNITATVYVASATTCQLLGGTLASPVAVPVAPTTSVAAPKAS